MVQGIVSVVESMEVHRLITGMEVCRLCVFCDQQHGGTQVV